MGPGPAPASRSGWSEHDRERRGAAAGTLERVVEAVAGEDFPDQRQADPLPARLGAEERREQVGLRLGGQAGALILDDERRAITLRRGADGDRAPGGARSTG